MGLVQKLKDNSKSKGKALERKKLKDSRRESLTALTLMLKERLHTAGKNYSGMAQKVVELPFLGSIMLGGELGVSPSDSVWWVTPENKRSKLYDDLSQWIRIMNKLAKSYGVDNPNKRKNRRAAAAAGIVAMYVVGAVLSVTGYGTAAGAALIAGATGAAAAMKASSDGELTLEELAGACSSAAGTYTEAGGAAGGSAAESAAVSSAVASIDTATGSEVVSAAVDAVDWEGVASAAAVGDLAGGAASDADMGSPAELWRNLFSVFQARGIGWTELAAMLDAQGKDSGEISAKLEAIGIDVEDYI